MKKLLIILIILNIFSIGCAKTVSADIIVSTTTESTIITETTINNDYINLKAEYDRLAEDNAKLKEDNEAYSYLLNNLNNLLRNVYPMKVSNANYSSEGIGFSIKYNDKYFMISAGHGVHYTYDGVDVLYTNFKFLDENWTSLKLLDYNNDYNNKDDYAIFTSSKIDSGFNVDLDNDKPLFIINDVKLISDYSRKTVEGESGSPVVDLEGEVTEIATTDIYSYNTDIDIVLQAIDKLK